MIKRKKGKKLKREEGPRKALMRSLAEALALRGKIKTTEAKARALRPFVERLVTHARNGNVASRRLLISRLGTAARAGALVKISAKYKDRAGGYTRIVKLPPRKSDGAKMAYIEFV